MLKTPELQSPPVLSQSQREALTWFVRIQDPQATQTALDGFSAWLAADPSHQSTYDQVVLLWTSPELHAALGHFESHSGLTVLKKPSKHWL